MIHGEFDGNFIPSEDFYLKSFFQGDPYRIPRSELYNSNGIQSEIIGEPTAEVYIVFTGIGFTMDDYSHENVYGIGSMIELQPFHGNQVIIPDPPEEIETKPVSFNDQVERTIKVLEGILTDPNLTNPTKIRMIGFSQGGHLIASILDKVNHDSPLYTLLSSIYIISPAAISNEGKATLARLLNRGRKDDRTIDINELKYVPEYIEELDNVSLTDTLVNISKLGVKVVLFPEFPEKGSLVSEEELKYLTSLQNDNFFVEPPPSERKHIPGHHDGSITLLQALGVKPKGVGESEDAWKLI